MRTPVARLLALVVTTCGLAFFSTAPALAHDSISSSDPADGAELSASPAQVALTFTDEVQAVGSQVVVADAAGTQVAAGAPAVVGTGATLPLPALANGPYTVTWRVVSSDGHPIDGTFTFTVADPAAVATEPSPETTALDEPTADATTAPTDGSETTDPATGPADAEAEPEEPSLPWPGIIVGGLLGLAAGIGLLQLSKRRKTTDDEHR